MVKPEIITFKADEALSDALKNIPNRSEFIRMAITGALGATCPLCQGSGVMSPHQKEHWENFNANHKIKKCTHCEELHLTCTETRKNVDHRSKPNS